MDDTEILIRQSKGRAKDQRHVSVRRKGNAHLQWSYGVQSSPLPTRYRSWADTAPKHEHGSCSLRNCSRSKPFSFICIYGVLDGKPTARLFEVGSRKGLYGVVVVVEYRAGGIMSVVERQIPQLYFNIS